MWPGVWKVVLQTHPINNFDGYFVSKLLNCILSYQYNVWNSHYKISEL